MTLAEVAADELRRVYEHALERLVVSLPRAIPSAVVERARTAIDAVCRTTGLAFAGQPVPVSFDMATTEFSRAMIDVIAAGR